MAPVIASLATVVTFCVRAERRTLRQFQTDSARIRPTAAAFRAGGVRPTKSPAYSTQMTATAAMEAVWITANRLHP